MAYIGIPRDLGKIKSRFALGMTGSQILHILTGAAIGVPLFFLTRGSLGNGPAMLILFASVAPFAFLALYEKDGQPARKWIYTILRHKIYPQRRLYKTQNFYGKINYLVYRQEVGRSETPTFAAGKRTMKEGEVDQKQKTGTGRPKTTAGKKRKGGKGQQKGFEENQRQ